MQYNQHRTLFGTEYKNYDMADLACETIDEVTLEAAKTDAPGIWYKTSMFNHSCVPNAGYSYIGDLMIVTANCDINVGEEIFLPYISIWENYDERQKELAKWGFHCSCALCNADALLSLKDQAIRMLVTTEILALGDHDDKGFATMENLVRDCLQTYATPSYSGLPFLKMANVLHIMPYCYLGDIDLWSAAPSKLRIKATECFKACLQLGCGIKLIEDTGSGYCELAFTKHGQPLTSGIGSLVGLAELAFVSEIKLERRRVGPLLACAKQLYKLRYAQDATFDTHHLSFRCKKASADASYEKPSPGWKNVKAKALAAASPVPAFLQ